jgi:hypothetical protein
LGQPAAPQALALLPPPTKAGVPRSHHWRLKLVVQAARVKPKAGGAPQERWRVELKMAAHSERGMTAAERRHRVLDWAA